MMMIIIIIYYALLETFVILSSKVSNNTMIRVLSRMKARESMRRRFQLNYSDTFPKKMRKISF
jgi:hypothetical protein